MEKVQEYFHSRFESMIPKKWAECHAFPCDVPKRKVEIEREMEEVIIIIIIIAYFSFRNTGLI